MMKKYRDKEWLREKYLSEGLTSREIAEICKTGKTTILRWLHKHGIPVRNPKGKGNRNVEKGNYSKKSWLREKYVDEKLSMRKIGNLCNVDRSTIERYLLDFDIKIRNQGSPQKHLEMDKELCSFLEGNLLGDGCLVPRKTTSACFSHTDNEIRYLEWVRKTLSDFDVEGRIEKRKSGWSENNVYQYRTKNYVEFYDLRKEWYPQGTKKIPNNFDLNPTKLFFWYIGDGGFYSYESKWSSTEKTLVISGKTLEKGMKEIVTPKLRKLGIDCGFNRGIQIQKNSHSKFFEYVLETPYRPPSYSYKFPEKYKDEFPDAESND